MSKKQQYTTKFYEGNGGVIDAVTRDESGKVVNVLSGFEADPGTGLSVLAAARENWPYADPFESYQWGGKTMEEVAEELEKMEYHPEMGDLIAETKATPDHYTDAQYIESVEINWSRMGAAGHELFKDLDVPEAVAYRIKSNKEWNPDDCRRLCELADMADEYDSADSDTVEDVVSAAADKLGVDIW
jgi:hypothetical protein